MTSDERRDAMIVGASLALTAAADAIEYLAESEAACDCVCKVLRQAVRIIGYLGADEIVSNGGN